MAANDAEPIGLPLQGLDEQSALRTILEGTASETGQRFFIALVENLAKVLKTDGAWVTEYFPESRRLRALAFWMDGAWLKDYDIDITGSPCEQVIDSVRLVHIPDRLLQLFPDRPEIKQSGAASYMGMPLLDTGQKILGHLAVVDRRPLPAEPRLFALFRIFAARAAAELRRIRAEAQVREREEKLSRLFDSAMDAIVEFDGGLRIAAMNPAAERTFQCRADQVTGKSLSHFLRGRTRERLKLLIDEVTGRSDMAHSLWIPDGLQIRLRNGNEFPAEATLARAEMLGNFFYTLILRNVNERREAERAIHALEAETEYLDETICSLGGFDEIIGQSAAFEAVLQDVAQVAVTDATVLILGETGTGKELIARTIHKRSLRSNRPLITMNCAAIPAALMESEFFGHEKGSFTGATQRREGCFALADRGTIFLDEIGELSLDLQAKLLRVLQEGEFAPVGSSRMKTVDVRVIAATNRDLDHAVRDGRFREDLYYRLNVFPIQLPPLRDRREDIAPLAAAFAQKFAQRMGRRIEPLSAECQQRLAAYGWPGNIRELQNVIERAVITAYDGRLNLDRALPHSGDRIDEAGEPASAATPKSPKPILRLPELQQLERNNIVRALESTRWRVAGKEGAAELLGVHPSTLNSRIRALQIQRPRRGS
jgi:PAS domain S-box-containing protein